jgi:hypothetical protein
MFASFFLRQTSLQGFETQFGPRNSLIDLKSSILIDVDGELPSGVVVRIFRFLS